MVLAFSVGLVSAQDAAGGALRGQVTDPSGAIISGADIIMTPAAGAPIVVKSNAQGSFEFKTLPAGKYTLTVSAAGFTLYENDNVVVADQPLRLNIAMTIAVEEEKVQVSDTAPTIDVNPSSNAGAIVISGKELEALPDDPDELQSDLQALAGPSAGPSGGQMYIDGFTGGQLPPKSSIREIRVNQNPFSSEYDKLGYGRIEVFTKPGTDKLHGQFMIDGNDSSFNAPNPFAGPEQPYYSTQINGNIGGPISKSASFFFNVDRRNVNELSVINATDPAGDGNLKIAENVPNPRQRTNIGPRFDWAINKNNTLTARYQYYRDTQSGEISNQFFLPTQAYSPKSTEQTVQISDTQIIGSHIVNETRFQYNRDNEIQSPLDTNPAVSVLGNFTGGGNSEGTLNNIENSYELQNYTSWLHGNHSLKFGGRLRLTHASDFSTSGFNGSFTFPTFAAFQAATPFQLNVTTGSPTAEVTYFDVEPYAQDDWRIRPNITLSLGLRFETQNSIHDHNDWAPRLGFAWGVGGRSGPPKVVIRGGSGIFYDRFQMTPLLQAQHLNGTSQEEFVVTNPTCFPGLDVPLTSAISSCGTPTSISSTIYQVDSHLHAPYTIQSAVSVERQITKAATVSVTYLNSRGFDQFVTINANAVFPGTPCYPNCAIAAQNVYRYFGDYIRTILPGCRVVLVLIGPNWLEARDETGRRRLDDPQDWVRIEIETALNASGLDVVPVLVNGARMPRAEELPQSLHPLLRRHAAIIRRDPDFHDDVARLSTALRASVQTGILDLANLGGERKATPARSALPRWALLVGATAAIAAVGFYLLSGGTTNGREFDDCNGAGWCPRMIVIPGARS